MTHPATEELPGLAPFVIVAWVKNSYLTSGPEPHRRP